MNEINNDVSEAITERIKSPFIISFVISWAVINWKFFTIVFLGNLPVLDRINQADKTLNIDSLYTSLIIASLYTFVWPWVTHLIVAYQSKIKLIHKKQLVKEEHEVELEKAKNNLAKIRFETSEQHAIEKLLKTQGNFKKQLKDQKEFIKEADALLAESEEKSARVANFRNMLSFFQRDHERFEEEFVKPELEKEE